MRTTKLFNLGFDVLAVLGIVSVIGWVGFGIILVIVMGDKR